MQACLHTVLIQVHSPASRYFVAGSMVLWLCDRLSRGIQSSCLLIPTDVQHHTRSGIVVLKMPRAASPACQPGQYFFVNIPQLSLNEWWVCICSIHIYIYAYTYVYIYIYVCVYTDTIACLRVCCLPMLLVDVSLQEKSGACSVMFQFCLIQRWAPSSRRPSLLTLLPSCSLSTLL